MTPRVLDTAVALALWAWVQQCGPEDSEAAQRTTLFSREVRFLSNLEHEGLVQGQVSWGVRTVLACVNGVIGNMTPWASGASGALRESITLGRVLLWS